MSHWQPPPTTARSSEMPSASAKTTALTEFLLARFADDEAAARAASEGRWTRGTTYTGLVSVEAPAWTVASSLDPADAEHIARHDPARVLAECEAKRRIVGYYLTCMEYEASRPDDYAQAERTTALAMLYHLALPYADHPDCREEWRA